MSAEVPNWKRCAGSPKRPDGHMVNKYATIYGSPPFPNGVCRGCALDIARSLVEHGNAVAAWIVQAVLDESAMWQKEFNDEARGASHDVSRSYQDGYERGRSDAR